MKSMIKVTKKEVKVTQRDYYLDSYTRDQLIRLLVSKEHEVFDISRYIDFDQRGEKLSLKLGEGITLTIEKNSYFI